MGDSCLLIATGTYLEPLELLLLPLLALIVDWRLLREGNRRISGDDLARLVVVNKNHAFGILRVGSTFNVGKVWWERAPCVLTRELDLPIDVLLAARGLRREV